MHDDTLPSTLQSRWQRLAETVCEQLEVMAPSLPAMTAEEQNAFENLMSTTFHVAKRCEILDVDLELEKNRSVPRDF
jgi:hypothetical protein